MPTLVVEDGTGLPNSNTFIDVAYADSYFTNRGITSWDLLVLADKELYIFNAAVALEAKWGVAYRGTLFSYSQAMLFPRFSFVDGNGRPVPSQSIPKNLKDSQCELSLLDSLGVDLFIDPEADISNIQSESSSVGKGAVSESFTYFGGRTSSTYQVALTLLRPLLKSTAFTGSAVRG